MLLVTKQIKNELWSRKWQMILNDWWKNLQMLAIKNLIELLERFVKKLLLKLCKTI